MEAVEIGLTALALAFCQPRAAVAMCEISDVGPVSVSTTHACALAAVAECKCPT